MLSLIGDKGTELAGSVEKRRARTGIRLVWHRMFESKLSVAGLVIVAVFVFCAIFGPLLAPYDPLAQNIADRLRGPTLNHPLGTDQLGRDILSRLLYGARVSLEVGVITVLIAVAIGSLLGLIAGYYRGRIDTIIMRISDAVIAFPALILVLGIAAALGRGPGTAFIAISIVTTPVFARLVRASVLSVREQEFVEAARTIGTRDMRIMFRHILPNVTEPIIVVGSLMVGSCIILEAALSFLGLGVRPPNPSWGSMLADGYLYLSISYWAAVSPGIAITLAVLGFNFLGDGLRDALDPRLRRAAGIQ